jgi:hypothetical protein
METLPRAFQRNRIQEVFLEWVDLGGLNHLNLVTQGISMYVKLAQPAHPFSRVVTVERYLDSP